MTVYFGDKGGIQLKRTSGAPINGALAASDVSVEKRRFSLANTNGINLIQGDLISGDQVDIRRTDGGGNLQLVSGHDYPDWRGYVFIDQLGGIRLYNAFAPSLVGSLEEGLVLIQPSEAQQIEISTRSSQYNFLGQIREYEITTERETIDITQLGNQFKKQYEAGLISGQGQINCFFEYRQSLCGEMGCGVGTEYVTYLAQLCIRLVQGADFFGRFFIYTPNTAESLDISGAQQSIWYEAECIVTNCTVNVSPTQVVETTINFVTTGPIKLLTGVPPAFLLQEDGALLLQEDGSRLVLAGQDV